MTLISVGRWTLVFLFLFLFLFGLYLLRRWILRFGVLILHWLWLNDFSLLNF